MKNLSLGVRNIRSFGDSSNSVKLSKFSLLTGTNGSGKSSFLRLLPLLRQSIEADTNSPILWYGRFVDFGDFGSARNSATKVDEGKLTFNFNITLDKTVYSDLILENFQEKIDYETEFGRAKLKNNNLQILKHNLDGISQRLPPEIEIDVCLEIEKDNLYQIELKIPDLKIKTTIQYDHNLNIKSFEISNLGTGKFCKSFKVKEFSSFEVSYEKFIPERLKPKREELNKYVKHMEEKEQKSKIKMYGFHLERGWVGRGFWEFEFYLFKGKLKELLEEENVYLTIDEINILAETLVFDSPSHFASQLENSKQFSISKDLCEDIRINSFGMLVSCFLEVANIYITENFINVRYIGPVRATSERFYRYQSLQVREMDQFGLNLPMVLNSLNDQEAKNLSEWIKESLGFEVQLNLAGAHYAVLVKTTRDDTFHNITDMGFGYSQVLPILVGIWMEINQSSKSSLKAARATARARYFFRNKFPITFAIEQPELHLHPALQYKLGEMLVKIALKNENINFVIETHSKPIVDAISNMIFENKLDPSLFSITTFEKNDLKFSEINHASFDEEGYINDWPHGFLSSGAI